MHRIMTADNTNSPEQVISKSQNVSGTAGGPEGQSVKQHKTTREWEWIASNVLEKAGTTAWLPISS